MSANAGFKRGEEAEWKADYQTAITEYTEAIRLKPDFILAYLNRADCYDAIGKTVEAKRDRAKA